MLLVWGRAATILNVFRPNIIVNVVVVGFATALLGFVVLLPLIGHATWHAYRETIDASMWPEMHA